MTQQRSNRKRHIRRRVLGGAVALFVAVWLVIAVTLASGHDPALSKPASADHVRPATTTTTTTNSTTTSAPSGVVTQQS